MRNIKLLLLAALWAFAQWRAVAAVVQPTTNQIVLTWESLGSGTQYSLQTSTNLVSWTVSTNTTATNVNLSFTADQARVFRLSATNSPPQSASLAWNAGASPGGVAGYFIYYGAATASYTNRINVGLATQGVVTGLVAGTSYYFATTAYDSSGLESVYSNEAVWQNTLQLRIHSLP
jgi:hypothetical protein